MPSISTTLETLRTALAERVNSKVFIGAPEVNEPGLYVFPIHHGISPALRSVRFQPETRPRRPRFSLECLMLAEPVGDFDIIDEGASFIHQHPILEIDGGTARLIGSAEPPGETANVFLAAGISYRLHIRFGIHVEPDQPGP